MKKNIFISSLLLGSVLSHSTLAIEPIKYIGVVNTAIVFKEHKKYKEMDKALQKDFQSKKASILSDKQMIEKEESELKEKIKNKKISKAAIKKEEVELADKKLLLNEKERILNEKIKESIDEGRMEILQDIQDKTIAYAKEHNIDMIIDSPSVIFSSKEQNITKELIDYINK